MLAWFAEGPDPDAGLLAFRRVSETLGSTHWFLRQLRDEPVGEVELRRAKDHLKGSLMLNLESTSSRMSHLARQEIYRDRTDTLDEMLAAIERVTAARMLVSLSIA